MVIIGVDAERKRSLGPLDRSVNGYKTGWVEASSYPYLLAKKDYSCPYQ